MATTPAEIKSWLEKGKEDNFSHVIIAVDTWDHEDYPIYVSNASEVQEIIDRYDSKHDRIMEVYNLSDDISEQLNQPRVWNI